MAHSWSKATARRAFPQDMSPDELTLDKAMELLDQAGKSAEPLGYSVR